MHPIVRFTLITALRDFLFIGLFFITLIAVGISYFLGKTALIENHAMTLSYVAMSARFIVVTGLVVFVCFHVRRSFENKEIELILSRPISRVHFVLRYWLGFVLLTLLTILPLIVLIAAFTQAHLIGLLYWGLSISVECMLMVALAMVASLMMQSSVSPVLLSMGFYFISRMMGYFMATVKIPKFYSPDVILDNLSEYIVMFTSIFFPRLDFFGKSEWLIYGIPETVTKDISLFLIQGTIYIPLLLAVAIFDFRRKQF